MAVRFILGRSGSGKTSYCIKAVVDALLEPENNESLILLIPEQASFQAERAIFADKRITGYSRLHVLSFDRLQFLLFGKNTARPELSRIGRVMAIHRLLRQNSDKLKVFDLSAGRVGLAGQLAETITELQRYANGPEEIEQLLQKLQKDELNNLTSRKFTDISLILQQYLQYIEGKFIDPDIQIGKVCQAVSQADFIKGARLWVDGFASFTAAELAALAEMLKTVSESQIALCLDPSEIDLANPDIAKIEPTSLFNPTQRTYAELVRIIKANKLKLTTPVILKNAVRFGGCPQLAHIEKNIFEIKAKKLSAADNIRLVSAPNKRTEAAFVARQIQQLIREKKLRYRDIAVIASDIESYRHYIKVYFDDYKIPFFIDRRKYLNQHPAVVLISSALQTVINGFSHSDIFAYLKNDLLPIERSNVDLLENYCLAFGVNSDEWQNNKDWNFNDEEEHFDLQKVNTIRKVAVGPLLELRDKFFEAGRQTKTIIAAEFARVIFDFFDRLGVREKIGEWIKQAIEQKDYAAVEEHQQFWSRFTDVFDELDEVFGEEKMTCQDYFSIINCAFSQLTLRFIPPSLDEVLVGSIERSRHPDLKAVFLIGATQREFPTPVRYDSILTDEDRVAAEEAKFPLAGGTRQSLTERQYLAYIAFTRPSQFLYVTYPLSDDSGSDVVRSQFVDNLQGLFENLQEESIADEQIDLGSISSKWELAEVLCSRLGKDNLQMFSADGQLEALLNGICADEQLSGLGATICQARDYDNIAQLNKSVVQDLFGSGLDVSATKLSAFAACPYQYFARYILELEQRKEFKLEPMDIGRFYHSVLDGVLKQLNAEKKDFASISEQQLLKILNGCISKILQENKFISNFAKRRAHNKYVIDSAGRTLEDCVRAIAEMVRAGQFRPKQSEVSFDDYEISLSDGSTLILRGKIDRLDIAEINGKKVAVIFDYKRKSSQFGWLKFYYGLDMQLPIYMLAVREVGSKYGIDDVVGAFYMPVEAVVEYSDLSDLTEERDKFAYKAKGIFNGRYFQQLDGETISKSSRFYNFYITKDKQPYGNYGKGGVLQPDDFEKTLRFTKNKLIHLAQEIISGAINVYPYKFSTKVACSLCKYKSVCRFDWRINDYNHLSSIDKTGVLEAAGGSDG